MSDRPGRDQFNDPIGPDDVGPKLGNSLLDWSTLPPSQELGDMLKRLIGVLASTPGGVGACDCSAHYWWIEFGKPSVVGLNALEAGAAILVAKAKLQSMLSDAMRQLEFVQYIGPNGGVGVVIGAPEDCNQPCGEPDGARYIHEFNVRVWVRVPGFFETTVKEAWFRVSCTEIESTVYYNYEASRRPPPVITPPVRSPVTTPPEPPLPPWPTTPTTPGTPGQSPPASPAPGLPPPVRRSRSLAPSSGTGGSSTGRNVDGVGSVQFLDRSPIGNALKIGNLIVPNLRARLPKAPGLCNGDCK